MNDVGRKCVLMDTEPFHATSSQLAQTNGTVRLMHVCCPSKFCTQGSGNVLVDPPKQCPGKRF